MKNSINISNDVNLILNTYRSHFFQTVTENLLCCSTSSTMPSKTSQQHSAEMERFWNLQRLNSKTILAPKWLTHEMSTNLPRQTKWGRM